MLGLEIGWPKSGPTFSNLSANWLDLWPCKQMQFPLVHLEVTSQLDQDLKAHENMAYDINLQNNQ